MPAAPTLTALAVLPFCVKVKASEPYCTVLPVVLLLTFRPLADNTLLLPAVSLKLTLLSVMSFVVFTVMVLPVRSMSMLVPLLIATVLPAFTALAASPSLCSFQPCSKVFTDVCKLLTLPSTLLMLLFKAFTLLVSALSKAFNCDTFTPSVSAEPAAILVIRRSLPALPIDTSPVAVPATAIGLPAASLGCQAALPILAPSATLFTPKATELPCVDLEPAPMAMALSTLASLSPPMAIAFLPVACEPLTELPPMAIAPSAVAFVAVVGVLPPDPMAVEFLAVAVLFIPMAVAC